mmetsp:Transcript_15868/g.40296  ORF Transcript_15868/g.40296 Transcript_15868/m.40296 type:complete len:476 (+) Transcript_15868:1271-2698(+)
MYNPQNIQHLALVLVNALHLNVEQSIRGNLHAAQLLNLRSQLRLRQLLHLNPATLELAVVRVTLQTLEQVQARDPRVRTKRLVDEIAQRRVAECKPASRRDAVRLVLKLLRVHLVEILEDGLLNQLRVDLRNAVHRVARDERQVSHADHLLVTLLYDGHAILASLVVAKLGAQLLQEAPVDVVDDLHVPRQQLLQQLHRPLLERLGEHRVVREREHLRRRLPRRRPAPLVHIHEKTHELRDANRRMRVVQLQRHLVREIFERAVLRGVPPKDVLQRRRHEEVLLLQAKLLALVSAVVGVKHAGNGLGVLLLENACDVVARVERLQVKLAARLGRPQAQVDRVRRAVSRDGVVVRHGVHLLGGIPHKDLPPILLARADMAVEADWIRHVRPLNLPRIAEREPVVGILALKAVLYRLAEHAVLVAQAVSPCGEILRRHRVQEARRKSPEPSISERGVALSLLDDLEVVAELLESLAV